MLMRYRLKHGFDIPLDGAAAPVLSPVTEIRRVAIAGADYRDLRPSLAIAEGDRVRAGETLFTDRRHPEIRSVAPGSGVIERIERGPRRRLESIVIELNDDAPLEWQSFDDSSLNSLPGDVIRERLLESGLWVSFRARPFERIAPPDVEPRAIFVTAIDTNPLAPDPFFAISAAPEDFRRGVTLISKLTQGRTYVCTAPAREAALPDLPDIHQVEFDGPHPAGLPGTHIHALENRIGDTPDLWHVGYQDVIAVGRFFATGHASPERTVAVCGPGAPSPRLVRLPIGAELSGLVDDETQSACRLISGSVLSGRQSPGFLGRYHNQVTILPHARKPMSRMGQFARMLRRGNTGLDDAASCASHGWPSGMLPLEDFECVWPYRSAPGALLRALLAGDTDGALALGCQGLAEEDMALCTYVCAGKQDYAAALRRTLNDMERLS
jgi:Na+-transporting NADH:ubiquinone oxidoreductase subunit A